MRSYADLCAIEEDCDQMRYEEELVNLYGPLN